MQIFEKRTPSICGDGPRMYKLILDAADASVVDIRLDRVAKKENNDGSQQHFDRKYLPSLGVMVVGTGISCVALIFVRPGRPSNAGSRTTEEKNDISFEIDSFVDMYLKIVVLK